MHQQTPTKRPLASHVGHYLTKCTGGQATVRDEEVAALVTGFCGFFSILAGYFLLLPFRDEAGVTLGTRNLPKLFASSLLLTLLATPLASFFLNRHPVRELGLQQLYRFLSLSVLVFLGLYLVTGAPTQIASEGNSAWERNNLEQLPRLTEHARGAVNSTATTRAVHVGGDYADAGQSDQSWRQQQQQQAKQQPQSTPQGQVEQQQRVWQAQQRLQTQGRQLVQAQEEAQWLQTQEGQQRGQAGRGEQVKRLEQQQAAAVGAEDGGAVSYARPPPVVLSPAQRAVRVAFFLSASLLNLVAVSSWWARAADVFSAESASRLFGIMGAGATLGQLVGSVTSAALVQSPFLRISPSSPSLLPLLLSATMLATAGECAKRFHAIVPAGSKGPIRALAEMDGGSRAEEGAIPKAATQRAQLVSGSSSSKGPARALADLDGASWAEEGGGSKLTSQRTVLAGSTPRGVSLRQTLASTAQGFNLIRCSGYLRHLCLFLVLNYIVSSFFYFEKSLVVASAVRDAASRTAWFARVNSAAAFCILTLQLLATGPVLRYLGLSRALAVTPAVAGLLMAKVALNPTPSSVGLAEVLRKVLTYSLARPAREVLFTVVTREEKYKAKIFIDTVVQRCGDALAAGAFQALDGFLGLGPSGVAVAAVPVCCAWVGVALSLGRRQEQLAASVQRKLVEANALRKEAQHQPQN